MRARFQFATLCYNAATMMVWGFLTIDAALNAGNSLSNNLSLFVRVWGESVTMVVLGFVLLVATFLVSSSKATHVTLGGVVGAMFSFVGVFVAIDLVQALASIAYSAYYGAGTSLPYTFAAFSFPVLLFAGFPLGLIGSLGAIRNSQVDEEPTST